MIRFDGHSRSGVHPREDVHHGELGEEEASPSPFVHADRSAGQIAKDFDLTETAVRDWVKQAEAALRRENRRLREDVDILKRATAFFAKETR
ncbi:hypothetical protein ABZ485_28880 [Streptomyces albogriseolus]|uniref:hypothetical protein n=1 Tax=Streptomyces albogriseolus TaxID=1887 RepID=UPI00345FE6A0